MANRPAYKAKGRKAGREAKAKLNKSQKLKDERSMHRLDRALAGQAPIAKTSALARKSATKPKAEPEGWKDVLSSMHELAKQRQTRRTEPRRNRVDPETLAGLMSGIHKIEVNETPEKEASELDIEA